MKKTFRSLLKDRRLIKSIGVHDVFAGLIAEQSGFETVFVGGFGATASLLGLPDLNLITLSEMAAVITRMSARLHVPIIADGDTGHGGVHNVIRTVREFEKAGASGIILEDQVSPKRCGHFEGKDVISPQEMVVKLKAAMAGRRNPDFVVIARTDARDVNGLQDAIRRVNLYRKAGADVVFIESPHSVEELRIIPKKVKAPLLVNLLTGGKTPAPSLSEIERMGYRIAVYPIESLLITAQGLRRLCRAVLKGGSVEDVRTDMISFHEVKDILGLPSMLEEQKLKAKPGRRNHVGINLK